MRNVVLTFKVTEDEAREIKEQAGPRKVSEFIRNCVLSREGNPKSAEVTRAAASAPVASALREEKDKAAFALLVRKHKPRMSTRAAEAEARKELERTSP